jgi:hypothetical protein
VRHVAPVFNRLFGRIPLVTRVGAEILGRVLGPSDEDRIKGLLKELDVMPVRPCDDDRQRDATPVG